MHLQKQWCAQHLVAAEVLWIFEFDEEVHVTNNNADDFRKAAKNSNHFDLPKALIGKKAKRSFTNPPLSIMLNANNIHGKYMALNCVPNQNCTITSRLS
jgi:hypothetical protein